MITDHLSYRLKTSGTWDDTIALLRRHIEHVDEYTKTPLMNDWLVTSTDLDAVLMSAARRRKANHPYLSSLQIGPVALLGRKTIDRRYYIRSNGYDSQFI